MLYSANIYGFDLRKCFDSLQIEPILESMVTQVNLPPKYEEILRTICINTPISSTHPKKANKNILMSADELDDSAQITTDDSTEETYITLDEAKHPEITQLIIRDLFETPPEEQKPYYGKETPTQSRLCKTISRNPKGDIKKEWNSPRIEPSNSLSQYSHIKYNSKTLRSRPT